MKLTSKITPQKQVIQKVRQTHKPLRQSQTNEINEKGEID